MSGKQRKVETKDLSKPYEPTPHERAAAEAYFARKEKLPPSPRMKVSPRFPMPGDMGVQKGWPDFILIEVKDTAANSKR